MMFVDGLEREREVLIPQNPHRWRERQPGTKTAGHRGVVVMNLAGDSRRF